MCVSGSENIYDFIQLIITASMSHIYVNKKGYSNYRKRIHYNSFKNSSIFQFGMKYSFINKRYTYLLLIFCFRTYYFLVYITLRYRHIKLLYITQIFTNVIIWFHILGIISSVTNITHSRYLILDFSFSCICIDKALLIFEA